MELGSLSEIDLAVIQAKQRPAIFVEIKKTLPSLGEKFDFLMGVVP